MALLGARLDVAVSGGSWNYTVRNFELPSSTLYIATFSIDIATPVTVTSTPPGWDVETDNTSYVLWFSTDVSQPYPSHIAPGVSLGGFQLNSVKTSSESTHYVITSWNHTTDSVGPVYHDMVLTPSRR